MQLNNRQLFKLGKFYLSQGMNQRANSTNDCGPTSVAMTINLILKQSNLRNKNISKKEVITAIPPLGRLPDWIPLIGGASAAWGLAEAFNNLAHENQIQWQAWRATHANSLFITRTLKKGGCLSILRIWKNGGAHWSNVVGFDLEKDSIYLLDPNPFLEHLPAYKKIQKEKWKTVKQDWERQPWWAKCLGIKKELIVYERTDK